MAGLAISLALRPALTQLTGLNAQGQGGGGFPPLPTPILLEGFESLTGVAGSGGASPVLDSNKVQGASSIRLEGLGVSGTNPRASKDTAQAAIDPSTLDVIAFATYIDTPRIVQSSQVAIGRGGTYVYSGAGTLKLLGNLGKGWYWHCQLVADMAGIATGVGQTGVRVQMNQNAPYSDRLSMDAVYGNARGRPTLVLTFDDTRPSHYTVAFPLLQSLGLKGTVYDDPNAYGVGNHRTLAQTKEMYAAGWDVGCDSTDDLALTSFATLADAVADVEGIRQFLVDNDMPRAKDHLCYSGTNVPTTPAGWTLSAYELSAPMIQAAAMTSDGSSSVSLGAAPATPVAVGMKVYAYGVPDGTTVEEVTDTTHITLSASIPARTVAAAFVDDSGEFYCGKLPAALKAAGFKTARCGSGVTSRNAFYSRFGFGAHDLMMPGSSSSAASAANMNAYVDNLIKYGETGVTYTHEINSDGGGLNMTITDFTNWMNYVAAKKAAGQLEVLTISQLWARDGASGVPS